MKSQSSVLDIRQNFWVLASIQCGSLGLLGMVLGWQLADKFGINVTIGSIFVGNLIVWLIGIVIISISSQSRINSIENIREVIGKWGALFAAFCLIFAFLSWYILQLKIASIAFEHVLQIPPIKHNTLLSIRSGAALGILAALLAVGGMRIIKWINIISLPILLIYHLYSIFISKQHIAINNDWTLSLSVISTIVLFFLPGTINLPTFFRHSRSLADSFLALTFMTIFYTFFQIASFWMKVKESMVPDFSYFFNSSLSLQLITIVFIILVVTANMLVNIYFASASWETIVPRFEGAKEYAIIGLIGTAGYVFIQISGPMQMLLNLANFFLANLGFVLLISFLLESIVKRKPKTFGRLVGSSSWLLSCIVATVIEIKNPDTETHTLLISLGVNALFFLCVIFIEETLWAINKLRKNDKKSV